MATISERIKQALEIREMKQADLIRKTGINKGALSSYISGKYEPKQNNIYLMAKALDVSEAWLMGKDVPIERYSSPFFDFEEFFKDDELTEMIREEEAKEKLEEEKKAKVLYRKYESVSPEIRAAIDTLLETAKKENNND